MNRPAFATPRCPGTLKESFSSYSPAVLRNLFAGKQVFHVLPELAVGKSWEQARVIHDSPGGQCWYRIKQVKNQLFPDKNGELLLKTVFPGGSEYRFHLEQPANEHLCLQLASQVFGLETLPNALIFFPDGQPAIICRQGQLSDSFTNFETLYQRFRNERGSSVRKKLSFHHMAGLLNTYCASSLIQNDRYFRIVVALWLVANAHGHMKNTGLVKTKRGDLVLGPVINLMCTKIHELSPELGMPGGLYDGDTNTQVFRENGHYSRNEFETFGQRLGLPASRIQHVLDFYVASADQVLLLIQRAFLPDEAKAVIAFYFRERISRLK